MTAGVQRPYASVDADVLLLWLSDAGTLPPDITQRCISAAGRAVSGTLLSRQKLVGDVMKILGEEGGEETRGTPSLQEVLGIVTCAFVR